MPTTIESLRDDYEKGLISISQLRSGQRQITRLAMVMAGLRISAAPFGYDRIDMSLVPNEDALHVRTMFEMRDAGAYYDEIAAHLNENDIRTKKGERWVGSTVRNILVNRIYNGETVYIGWGARAPIIVSTPHTRLVDVHLFVRVRDRLKVEPSRSTPKALLAMHTTDAANAG